MRDILINMKNKTKKQKAQAMVVAFIYVCVISLIGIYMMTYAKNLHDIVVREVRHSMGFYAGEAGLINAFASLDHGGGLPGALSVPPMTVTVTEIVFDAAGRRQLWATVTDW